MLPSEAGELTSWKGDAQFSHLDELDKWLKGKKMKTKIIAYAQRKKIQQVQLSRGNVAMKGQLLSKPENHVPLPSVRFHNSNTTRSNLGLFISKKLSRKEPQKSKNMKRNGKYTLCRKEKNNRTKKFEN